LIETLLAIEVSGGRAWPFQGDVGNQNDMLALKRFVDERFGALDGAILAAGKLGFNNTLVEELDGRTYAEHFSSKSIGVMNFVRMFGDCGLDFCVVVSSLSTILGGIGHCAYSAANQVADAVIARQSRASAGTWVTTNWDLWRPRNPS